MAANGRVHAQSSSLFLFSVTTPSLPPSHPTPSFLPGCFFKGSSLFCKVSGTNSEQQGVAPLTVINWPLGTREWSSVFFYFRIMRAVRAVSFLHESEGRLEVRSFLIESGSQRDSFVPWIEKKMMFNGFCFIHSCLRGFLFPFLDVLRCIDWLQRVSSIDS